MNGFHYRHVERMLQVLERAYEFRILGQLPGRDRSVYLQGSFGEQYAMFFIAENGGELNVGKVNHDSTMRSVAYGGIFFGQENAATMAYRCAMVMRGEDIDYNYRLSNDDEACLLGEEEPMTQRSPVADTEPAHS